MLPARTGAPTPSRASSRASRPAWARAAASSTWFTTTRSGESSPAVTSAEMTRATSSGVAASSGAQPARSQKSSGRWAALRTGEPRPLAPTTRMRSALSGGTTGSCAACALSDRRLEPSASTRTWPASWASPATGLGEGPSVGRARTAPAVAWPPAAPTAAWSTTAALLVSSRPPRDATGTPTHATPPRPSASASSPSSSEVTSGTPAKARKCVVVARTTLSSRAASSPAIARSSVVLPPLPTTEVTPVGTSSDSRQFMRSPDL